MALNERSLRMNGYFAVYPTADGWAAAQYRDWHRGEMNSEEIAGDRFSRKAEAIRVAKSKARKMQSTHVIVLDSSHDINEAFWPTKQYQKLYLAPLPEQHEMAKLSDSGTRWGVNGYAKTKSEFYTERFWGGWEYGGNRPYQSDWRTKSTAREFADGLLRKTPFKQVEIYKSDGMKQTSKLGPLAKRV